MLHGGCDARFRACLKRKSLQELGLHMLNTYVLLGPTVCRRCVCRWAMTMPHDGCICAKGATGYQQPRPAGWHACRSTSAVRTAMRCSTSGRLPSPTASTSTTLWRPAAPASTSAPLVRRANTLLASVLPTAHLGWLCYVPLWKYATAGMHGCMESAHVQKGVGQSRRGMLAERRSLRLRNL